MDSFEKHLDENQELYKEYMEAYATNMKKLFEVTKRRFESVEMIEVKKSPIHGRGLFSKIDIPKYTYITQWPAHWIPTSSGEIEFKLDNLLSPMMATPEGTVFYKELCNQYDNAKGTALSLDEADFMKFNNMIAVEIMKDIRLTSWFSQRIAHPFITNEPELLGHLVNDVISLKLDATDTVLVKRNKCIRYAIISHNDCNCVMTDHGLISYQPVKAGEELTFSYGVPFWLRQNNQAIEEIQDKDLIHFLTTKTMDWVSDDR